MLCAEVRKAEGAGGRTLCRSHGGGAEAKGEKLTLGGGEGKNLSGHDCTFLEDFAASAKTGSDDEIKRPVCIPCFHCYRWILDPIPEGIQIYSCLQMGTATRSADCKSVHDHRHLRVWVMSKTKRDLKNRCLY